MNYLSWILIWITSKITRRLFIRETKKLSKKLGIPLWKVQALIIGGVLVCIGGIWYIKTNATKEGFKKGFDEGVKSGINTGYKSGFNDGFMEGVNKGKWKVVDEIAKMEPGNEFIEYLDELGVIVKTNMNISRLYMIKLRGDSVENGINPILFFIILTYKAEITPLKPY